MTSTRVEVEKKPLVRVLVLSKQGGVLSENMESQLGLIETGGNCHIEHVVEAENEEITALRIKQGNYDLVLVDKNTTLSAWKIAELTAKSESGQTDQQSDRPRFYLDGAVEAIVDREIHHTQFSGSIGMIKDGKLLIRKSYGNANQSEQHESKNEPKTKFGIASITKMFTAVAIAKLVEEGKVKYDALVSDFLPDTILGDNERIPFPNKQFFIDKHITVKDLLLHTSGLGQFQAELFFKDKMLDFKSIDDYSPMLSPSSSAAKLIFEPKTDPYNKFLYSNINSLLLGHVIQQASGKDYCRYIQEDVLPRNMMDTTPRRGADQSFALSYAPKPELECDIEADSLHWLRVITNKTPNNKGESDLKQIATRATELLTQYKEKMDTIFSLYQNGLASVENEEDLSRFKSNFKEFLHQTFQTFDAINIEIKNSLERLEKILEGVSPDDKERLKKLFTDLYKNLDVASEPPPGPKSAPYLLYSLLSNLNIAFPAANFRSTADDLLVFQESLWKNKDIISDPESLILEKTQIPGSAPSPDRAQLSHYGYGVCIWENGTPMESVGHDGQTPGACSTARFYRKAGISIATLANVENGDHFTPVNLIERHLIASCVQESNIRYFDPVIPSTPHSNQSLATEIERISKAKLSSATQGRQTAKKPTGDWARRDLAQKQRILKALYNNIDKLSSADKAGLISFLAVCLQKEKAEISALFDRVSITGRPLKEFVIFERFFQALNPLDAKVIPLNCPDIGFNPWSKLISAQHLPENGQALLEEYINDSDLPVALSVSDSQQTIHIPASGVDRKLNVYPIHSVAKVFTGVLTLMMIHEKPDGENSILPEANLDKPIKELLDSAVWVLLPEAVQKHIQSNNVTLRQVMTHQSGLGDYGYDRDTGTYRDKLERGETTVVKEIRDFLQFSEEKTYPVGKFHYSNLGITLAGLAVENACKTYKSTHPELSMPPPNFFGMLEHYILKPANMDRFFKSAPKNSTVLTVQTNPDDKAALNWVGGPAGGYWTTTNDLVKFGQWLYEKCQNPTFRDLLERHGEEFYRDRKIMHPGSSPYSSAFFFVDLATGKTGALASTEGSAASLGFELALGNQVFTSETTKPYKDRLREMKQAEPGYMAPTQSSKEKEREKYSPLTITPQPPWRR